MNAAAFLGSPRHDGNSAFLAKLALAELGRRGYKTESFSLASMSLAPCDACERCREAGRCVVDDGFSPLRGAMERSDVWVLASPIYWWGITAQAKTFVDRWYSIPSETFRGKKALVILTLGDSDAETASFAVGSLRESLKWRGIGRHEFAVFTGMPSRNSAAESATASARVIEALSTLLSGEAILP